MGAKLVWRQHGPMRPNSRFDRHQTISKPQAPRSAAHGLLPAWVETAHAEGFEPELTARPQSPVQSGVAEQGATPTDQQLLSAKQAAQILGVSQKTVRRLLAWGVVGCVRFGRLVRIDHRELESVMKTGTGAGKLKTAHVRPSGCSERPRKSQSSSDTED